MPGISSKLSKARAALPTSPRSTGLVTNHPGRHPPPFRVRATGIDARTRAGLRYSLTGSSRLPEAKRAHGQFECLAHNLLLLAEREMKELGLEDEVERKKGIRRSNPPQSRREAHGAGREFHRTCGHEGDATDSPLHPLAACPHLQRGSPGRFSCPPRCGMGLLDGGLFHTDLFKNDLVLRQ